MDTQKTTWKGRFTRQGKRAHQNFVFTKTSAVVMRGTKLMAGTIWTDIVFRYRLKHAAYKDGNLYNDHMLLLP